VIRRRTPEPARSSADASLPQFSNPGETRGLTDLGTLVRTAWAFDRRRVMTQMVLSALSGVLGGAGLVLLVPIVNSVAGETDQMSVPLFGSIGIGSWPLAGLLGLFVALVSVQAVISRTSALNSARLQQQVVDRLRHGAFESILMARWSFVLGMRRSDIVQVVTAGASRSGMAVQQVMNGSVALVLALATAVVAVAVAPLVGSVAVVLVVIMAVLQGTGVRPASRLGRQFSDRSRSLQAVITDSLDSLRLVRAHDASGIWVDRLADAFTSTREVQIANTERMSTIAALSSVGMAVAMSAPVLCPPIRRCRSSSSVT
jgi:ABC-type multidrug transport system fused ATPase/permease subunit